MEGLKRGVETRERRDSARPVRLEGSAMDECSSNPGSSHLLNQRYGLRLWAKSRVPAPEHIVQFVIENFCPGLK